MTDDPYIETVEGLGDVAFEVLGPDDHLIQLAQRQSPIPRPLPKWAVHAIAIDHYREGGQLQALVPRYGQHDENAEADARAVCIQILVKTREMHPSDAEYDDFLEELNG